MTEESITIADWEGRRREASAEVIRYSEANRVTFAILYVVGGLFAGTMCIVVPIAHLITTWGFPLLGIYMAIRTMRRKTVVHAIESECPRCGERMQMTGGSIDEAEWQTCPKCHAKLSVRVEDPAAGA